MLSCCLFCPDAHPGGGVDLAQQAQIHLDVAGHGQRLIHIAAGQHRGRQVFKGCVDKDDTNPTIDKIAAADMILFATPVYWWGMSAQLKLIIDKCYCRGMQLKNKKVGTIVVGGSPVDSIQYELIDKQFDCMAKYLSWDLLFQKSYYATAKDELSKNQDAMKELEDIGKDL